MKSRLLCGASGRRIGEIPERGDPGQQHLQMISAHVSAYITHVRTQLKQTIPKAIVHCLVSTMTCSSNTEIFWLYTIHSDTTSNASLHIASGLHACSDGHQNSAYA